MLFNTIFVRHSSVCSGHCKKYSPPSFPCTCQINQTQFCYNKPYEMLVYTNNDDQTTFSEFEVYTNSEIGMVLVQAIRILLWTLP